MEKNTIRICSDPYRRHTDYYWYEEDGTWSDMSQKDESKLNTERFISSQIPQIAYDVLKEVKELASPAGIKIIFEGTDDDYERFALIRDAYYADSGIDLKRGEKKMNSAEEVMSQIEISYGKLEEYFREYYDKETEEELAKYRETVKQEIVLCVTGLYSSGKSAFINSLIGQEILPSASDPATAKIYKIRPSEKCRVVFTFQGENYVIEFEDQIWGVNRASDSEIMQFIRKKIEEMKSESTEQLMYWTLSALNDYAQKEGEKRHEELVKYYNQNMSEKNSEDDEEAEEDNDEKVEAVFKKHRVKELTEKGYLTENKLGDSIEVFVNFRHSYLPLDDRFEFVIYDTPGSNSAMFREHLDILKESLECQTNGLPIFVTDPDHMDAKDNKQIIKMINQMGVALDKTNMMVIVNKSDEKAKSVLLEKGKNKEKLAVTKWKSDRVYFVSSIMGLGGKKEKPENAGEWIDKSYAEIYKKNIEGFYNPDCEGYKRLFDCNILPEDSRKRIAERTEKIAETERLIWNSGIPCVEEEIGTYARKYALYNKCAQAIGNLDRAAKRMEESVEKAKEREKELHSEIEKQLDERTKKLIKELKEICESGKKKATSQFADCVVHASVGKYLDESRIRGRVAAAYCNSDGKKDYERLRLFSGYIESYLAQDMKAYSAEKSEGIEKYWKKCADDLRASLLKEVVGSTFLSDEQKALLAEVLLRVVMPPSTHKFLNIENTRAIKHKGKRFLWINRTRIDRKKSTEEYRNALEYDISESNKRVTADNERMFDNWIVRILNILEAKLSDFNPYLKHLSKRLEEQQKMIETKQQQEDIIKNEIYQINRLLEFEEMGQ